MFQNKNLKSFLNIKVFSIFVLAFVLGLTCNMIFGRHIFVYSITETFTEKEVAAKINKRVRADFSGKFVNGTIVSYGTDEGGESYVSIVFDSPLVTSTADKIYKLDFGKQNYHQLITEMDTNK